MTFLFRLIDAFAFMLRPLFCILANLMDDPVTMPLPHALPELGNVTPYQYAATCPDCGPCVAYLNRCQWCCSEVVPRSRRRELLTRLSRPRRQDRSNVVPMLRVVAGGRA